jgi:hypothetical protein
VIETRESLLVALDNALVMCLGLKKFLWWVAPTNE